MDAAETPMLSGISFLLDLLEFLTQLQLLEYYSSKLGYLCMKHTLLGKESL